MTTETLFHSPVQGSESKEEECSRFFDLMQTHVNGMPYTSSQKEKLGELLSLTKQRWSDIICETKRESEASQGSAAPVGQDNTFDPLIRSGRSLLSRFCRDLNCASFAASMNAGSTGPDHYELSGNYLFSADLGPKDRRVKKSTKVVIAVPNNPEVVTISYPGKRTLGIAVGSCAQFDSGVYFGDDGKIYLVDNELTQREPPVIEGRKVYESEDTLLWSWRTFTMD